jgi:hypothetical protein
MQVCRVYGYRGHPQSLRNPHGSRDARDRQARAPVAIVHELHKARLAHVAGQASLDPGPSRLYRHPAEVASITFRTDLAYN